jgi:hypothetical protein
LLAAAVANRHAQQLHCTLPDLTLPWCRLQHPTRERRDQAGVFRFHSLGVANGQTLPFLPGHGPRLEPEAQRSWQIYSRKGRPVRVVAAHGAIIVDPAPALTGLPLQSARSVHRHLSSDRHLERLMIL